MRLHHISADLRWVPITANNIRQRKVTTSALIYILLNLRQLLDLGADGNGLLMTSQISKYLITLLRVLRGLSSSN